jgi:two-component system sensor histidine kinase and response regulator WspE
MSTDFADSSMLDLFRLEAEGQGRALETGLLALESGAGAGALEPLMRAAHSLKGAARIVGLSAAVELAHAMEDVLESGRKGARPVSGSDVELLLKGADIFLDLSRTEAEAIPDRLAGRAGDIEALCANLRRALSGDSAEAGEATAAPPASAPARPVPPPAAPPAAPAPETSLADASMLDLFRLEAEGQGRALETGLLALESGAGAEALEPLMRAAHSLKGAARIVGLSAAVELAHAMEDVLESGRKGARAISPADVELLLNGTDIFQDLSRTDAEAIPDRLAERAEELTALCADLRRAMSGGSAEAGEAAAAPARPAPTATKPPTQTRVPSRAPSDGIVRVAAGSLTRLMGLAGECLIRTKSLEPLGAELEELRHLLIRLSRFQEGVRLALSRAGLPADAAAAALDEAEAKLAKTRRRLARHAEAFDLFSRRLERLAGRLYREVIDSRMRPFADGLHGLARMVRDLAKDQGKQIEFTVLGEESKVDRDILERLEAPLTHLLRNAVDHGLEPAAVRTAAGKAGTGRLTLEARHQAGMLAVTVSDDGRGLDPEAIRTKVVERGLSAPDVAARLSREELFEFLFLPGFTTAVQVTEVSGRGVGLDVVRTMVGEVGGTIRVRSETGRGTSFVLRLPLTLSVLRALLVSVDGHPYALPLSRLDRVVEVEAGEVAMVEARPYVTVDGQAVGLVEARQVFGLPAAAGSGVLCVAVVSDRLSRFGLVVDAFLGEVDLVVKPLDKRLGKVVNVSAVAALEDGSPVLILDVDDLVRSIDAVLARERPRAAGSESAPVRPAKRVLVVDDSLTVREMERRLLANAGYEVETAVDGMDGWNKLAAGRFDLVVTDVDMPRASGLELTRMIRAEAKTAHLPVMIVSYKDREDDRRQGLEAGANHYLAKSGFHDRSMLAAVADLIGEA